MEDGGGWGGVTFANNVGSPAEVDAVVEGARRGRAHRARAGRDILGRVLRRVRGSRGSSVGGRAQPALDDPRRRDRQPRLRHFRDGTTVGLKIDHELPVGNVDIKVIVDQDGERLGQLKVSRGSIDWKPGKAKRTWQLEWERFDQLMREFGHPPR